MSNVFVVDTNKQPLGPVHPARARKLLDQRKAAVYRRYPFVIILKVAISDPVTADLRVKLDPGSKTTGMAVVNDSSCEVVFAAELSHRGHKIKESLDGRRAIRRSRRNRKTRYRKARWQNRRRREGWLAPSMQSRISNILTWISRLKRFCKITSISLELVRFDMQLMETPSIEGVEYQQGTLAGYEPDPTYLRSGEENVPTVARKIFLSRLSISSHVPKVAQIGSRTCALHARSAIWPRVPRA